MADGEASRAGTETFRRRRLADAVLFGLPFLLYAGSLPFGLLGLDDGAYYLDNTALQGGRWGGLWTLWQRPILSDYSPVVQLTVWLDLALFGEGSWWAVRLHGLAWFGLGVLGVRALVERVTGRPGLARAVALLYLAHPACLPGVVWLAERKQVVGLAFTWWSLERYVAGGAARTARERASRYAAATFLFLLALLAKPHAALIPPVVSCYEACLGAGPALKRLLRTLPFWVLGAGFAAINILWVREDLGHAFYGGSRGAALANDGHVLWHYLRFLVWPAGHALFYGVPAYPASSAWVWGSWLALLVLAGALVLRWRRTPVMLWAGLGGFLALGPALNFFPQLPVISDHYLNWALPFWLLALAAGVDEAGTRWLSRWARWRCGLLAAAALTWACFVVAETPAYRDGKTLFGKCVERQPGSALCWAWYAHFLSRSADPRERPQAGPAGLRALEAPDAERLLPLQRMACAREAASWLHAAGRGEEAARVLDEALAPLGDTVDARLTRAEVLARLGAWDAVAGLLDGDFTPELEAWGEELYRMFRAGGTLPDQTPSRLETRPGSDAHAERLVRGRSLRALTFLGLACLKQGRTERAWRALAVVLNAAPEEPAARELLAQACRDLGAEAAPQRLAPPHPAGP